MAAAAICCYYKGFYGIVPGTDALIDFGNYIKGILKAVGKLDPTTPLKRLSLLVDNMRDIRTLMDLNNYENAALWALFIAQ